MFPDITIGAHTLYEEQARGQPAATGVTLDATASTRYERAQKRGVNVMVLNKVTDKLRTRVHDALSSTRGDNLRPIKLLREVLGTANDLAGRPFCSQTELDERRHEGGGAAAATRREAAPVMLYFDGKDHRTKKKIEELLQGREIPFQLLDVTDDEATRSWAMTQAKQVEFPLVFVAGVAVGGLHELMQLDVNGELKKRVFGG